MPNDHPHGQGPNYITVIHAIVIFAQEHAETFHKWVNEHPGTARYGMTVEDCSALLADAHEFVEAVTLATELNLTETIRSQN